MATTMLTRRGALLESPPRDDRRPPPSFETSIPLDVLELVPESVAREKGVIPLGFDGETITMACGQREPIALADHLRFLLAKDVHLVWAPPHWVREKIDESYGQFEGESADSMLQEFTDTSLDLAESMELGDEDEYLSDYVGNQRFKPAQRKRAVRGDLHSGPQEHFEPGGSGMFFYTVNEGQRALKRKLDGSYQVIEGPQRGWRGFSTFSAMPHHTAHPGEYLQVRFRDGRQQHVVGPAEIWFDKRSHQEIETHEALQLSAKEAVVVYTQGEETKQVARRIEYGPTMFVPQPFEWLHKFSWHASRGGHQGVQKVPNALVFNKLWLMPDQMYHDVTDVRTSDDAVLTIRLMIFYELIDIEQMLDTTHDPIGDLVNAATADVVEFTGRHDFESFKKHTEQLNELETYRQLAARVSQCGYRINNVVYRGYGAPDSLQQMHDQAIEARTRLQLERATEQQSQDLENYKLDCQLGRASKRRAEQADEVRHDLEMQRRKCEADLENREKTRQFQREQDAVDAEVKETILRRDDHRTRDHLTELKQLDVELTQYLTQSRADRVIELRGASKNAHLHLESQNGA